MNPIDPQLAKFIYALKEEEMLSYFIRVNRQRSMDNQAIIAAWTRFKPTLNESNIDLQLAEYRLRLIVGENRASLAYDVNLVHTMIEKAVERARS